MSLNDLSPSHLSTLSFQYLCQKNFCVVPAGGWPAEIQKYLLNASFEVHLLKCEIFIETSSMFQVLHNQPVW